MLTASLMVAFAIPVHATTPTLTAGPSSGPPGFVITVRGAGFDGSLIQLRWDSTTSDPLKDNLSSPFTVHFQIPTSAAPGLHHILASCATCTSGASADVMVTAPPTLSTGIAAVRGDDAALWVKAGTAGFHSLGGILLAAPAVVAVPTASGGTTPLYIALGGDHRLYVRSTTASWALLVTTPHACYDTPGAAVLSGDPYILNVACMGGDHGLYAWSTALTAGVLPTISTGFASYGGSLVAGPAVVSGSDSFIYYVVSTDRELRFFQPGAFLVPGQDPFGPVGGECIGHPAVFQSLTTLYAACQGLDHQLYYRTLGASPSAWASAGGALIDGPGIAVLSTGVAVYVEGTNRALFHTVLNLAATSDSGFTADGGLMTFGVGAAGLP